MKIIDIKCPKCGGELHISEGRKDCFCEYCGSHLLLDELNSVTNIQVFRDEARLKELEMEEAREKEFKEKQEKHRNLVKIFLVSYCLLFMFCILIKNMAILLFATLFYCVWFLYIVVTSPNNEKK